jgi:hypothetical protein
MVDILTDSYLYCKFYHKGIVKYSKATKLNSKSLSCELVASNLTLNTELINIGIGTNQSKFIDLNLENITFVYLREPISYSGIPEIVKKLNHNSNFTLDILDARQTSRVSYSNYTITISPNFHETITINCTFEQSSPICSFPTSSFNYVPLKLNMKLIVSSPYFTDQTSFSVKEIYHTGKYNLI